MRKNHKSTILTVLLCLSQLLPKYFFGPVLLSLIRQFSFYKGSQFYFYKGSQFYYQ